MKEKYKVYHSKFMWDIPKNYTGIVYYESSSTSIKSYHKDGKLHRKNGPAYIFESSVLGGVNEYWLDGKQYTENEWRKQLKKKKKVSLTELKPIKPKKEESKTLVWKVQFIINEYDEFKDNVVSTVTITSFKNQLENKIRPLYESFIKDNKKFSITVYQDDKKQFTAKNQGSVIIIDGTKTPFSTWLREISK